MCDMLDSLGYGHQAMHQRLRLLLPDPRTCGFVGRARTQRWMEKELNSRFGGIDLYPEFRAEQESRSGRIGLAGFTDALRMTG